MATMISHTRRYILLGITTVLLTNELCHGQDTVTYKPAKGYFFCSGPGKSCRIQNCSLRNKLCDRFISGFELNPYASRSGSQLIYTSTGDYASITLGKNDADAVICDAECSCQALVSEGDGSCQLAPVTEPPTSFPSTSTTPSTSPSVTPSDPPSTSPSRSPSRAPSSKPSFSPSRPPTMSPTINSSIPALLRQVSGDAVFDSSTPQYQATRWLIRRDNLGLDPHSQHLRLHQRYALVALDFAFHRNDESQLNWADPDLDECEWDGVTCQTFDGVPRVRTINWARRNLSGTVLPEFRLLPALETLDLAHNKITGDLHPFSSLVYLKNLYLFENRFHGTLDSIGGSLTRLERLYLGFNQLSGTLSSNLWQPNRDRPLRKFSFSK